MMNWFEIPADDLERAKRFYTELFGWKIEEFPAPFRKDFLLVRAADLNAIFGSLTKRQDNKETAVNYINVSCTEKYINRIEPLGGKVLVPKTAVPGMGYFTVCQDTERNAFAIWEDDTNAS